MSHSLETLSLYPYSMLCNYFFLTFLLHTALGRIGNFRLPGIMSFF